MTAESTKQDDREQARESVNTLRFLGGLFLVMALLLYFFHLAEVPMGQHSIGVLACIFGAAGVALLWIGRRRISALR
jgi:Na+/melibiose symporter-like transporter